MNKFLILLATALLVPYSFNAFAQDAKLNDGQIVGIVQTINKGEVEAGNLARSTSRNSEVKMYGHRLVGEHNGSNWLINDLAKKQNISAQDSSISNDLKEDANKNLSKLKGLQGQAFDVAYIDHEVDDHQKAIDLFDKTLIPSAKNEELKDLLKVIRTWLGIHLEHAKIIQTSLGKKQ